MIDKIYLDNLEYKITGACIEVHKALGPGLLESVYHKCLIRELQLQNILFVSEQIVAVSYKDIILDTELRADLFIENCIVLELWVRLKEYLLILIAQILFKMGKNHLLMNFIDQYFEATY
jgi:GxxExxY protein